MQTDRYYAAHDSVFFEHLMRDVADYFDKVSGGTFTVNYTVHPRTVNLPEPMWFYGNHPEYGEQPVLLADAVVDSLDDPEDVLFFPITTPSFWCMPAPVRRPTSWATARSRSSAPTWIRTTSPPPRTTAFWRRPYLPATGFAPGAGIDRVLILPETEQQDPVGIFDWRFRQPGRLLLRGGAASGHAFPQ